MREWLSHYKWQGIDRILLMDNNSTDDWRPALKGFEGMVDTVSAAKDYAEYQKLCGEIRGLSMAEGFILDLAKQMEFSDD